MKLIGTYNKDENNKRVLLLNLAAMLEDKFEIEAVRQHLINTGHDASTIDNWQF